MIWNRSCTSERPQFRIQEVTQSMKSLRILSLLTLVLTLTPAVFAADFGIRGGRYDDMSENFVGAEMVFDIGAVNINPNVEYSLADNFTAGSANLDVTFDVVNFGRVTPYVGAGVGLWYLDTDFGNTTDLLGNLIGGVSFNLDFLKPYAQVKYFRVIEAKDGGTEDDLAFTVGLRF
jgi:opacity protein-like surface antigen